MKKWAIRFGPFILAPLVALSLALRLWQTTRRPNVVRYYNVWVVKRTSDQSFHALAYNAGMNDWNEFVVTSCPDWTPTQEIQTGVTLKLLQYVEDRVHSCMELTGEYGGYTLERDSHDQPRISPDPRPQPRVQPPGSPPGWPRTY